MARQFGVTTGKDSLTGVILNTASKKTSVTWSEPKDENGHVTDRKALSKTDTLSFSGVLDAATFTYSAGAKITVGEVDYGINSTDVSESENATTFTVEASNADGATITPYTAPAART